MNSNSTRYYIFDFSDGQVISEKCRNSFGGFNNCIKRIETALGQRVRGVAGTDGEKWETQDKSLTFTITEVTKEGMLIG